MDSQIQNMTFGVELEVHIPRGTLTTLCQLIGEATGKPCAFEGYHHNTRTGWKVVTDGSLAGAGSTGFEFVSPILKGEAGLQELKKVLEILNANGATVGSDCGTHVHVGVGRNPDVSFLKRLFKSYLIFEPAIDSLMPRSRRGTSRWANSLTTVQLDRIEAAREWRDLLSTRIFYHDRFYKLNFFAISRHGTVEYRQHSGTIEFEKISNWIQFCLRFTQAALSGAIAVPSADGTRQVNRARRGSKSWQAGEMMLRPEGCSPQEAQAALGWPTISLGHQAAICGLQIHRERMGRSVRFYARSVSSSTQIEAGPATLERLLTMIGAAQSEREYFTARAAHFAARQAA